MAAVTEELTASQRGGRMRPVARFAACQLFGPDADLKHLAEAPCVDQILHGCDQGMEAHAVRHHQNAVEPRRGGDEVQALIFAVRHRFFQEHVLSRLQAILGDGVVKVVRQHDEDGVDPVENGSIVGGRHHVRQVLPDLSGPGRVDVDGGGELQPVLQQVEATQVSGGHAATADQCEFDDCHRDALADPPVI